MGNDVIFKFGQAVTLAGHDGVFVVEEDVYDFMPTVGLVSWSRSTWTERAERDFKCHTELSQVTKRKLSYEEIVEITSLISESYENNRPRNRIRGFTPSPAEDSRSGLLKQFLLVNKPESLRDVILSSHDAVCESKEMSEKEAFGHHPAVYYSLAMCGECGELANNIVKAMRDGPDKMEKMKEAISSELQDVIIYAYILAETNGIVIDEIVKSKVDIVIQRAKDGYYGKPLERKK